MVRPAARSLVGHLPDDIPVGIELLLPPLIEQAIAEQLIAPRPLSSLAQLGAHRRRLLAQYPIQPGSPLSHSWEGLGLAHDPQLLDGSGGIGHSPTATAAWLHADGSLPVETAQHRRAAAYLRRAAAATGDPHTGLVPTVWPIDGFELVWVLYALALSGLLNHPVVADLAAPHLTTLRARLTPDGIGMSPYFTKDGDITATSLATLLMAGNPVDIHIIDQFAQADHYRTYPYELQPSLTTTAHALHARALAGADITRTARFLSSQQVNGRWTQDKWHSSWLYTTSAVLTALVHSDEHAACRAGIATLLATQHPNGGWGTNHHATAAETAYVQLALRHALGVGYHVNGLTAALNRSWRWLNTQWEHAASAGPHLWIGKELYTPYRVDQAFFATAVLAEELADELQVPQLSRYRRVG
ncbi:MAG: hypothetical protein HC822_22415 [Oscillochloris sp.]|nr:hypothetical protein [Oscillochloris sp.]